MNKYNIPVIFTNHAKERMSRLSGVSENFVKKDLLMDIYCLRRFEGSNIFKTTGKNFQYIFTINKGKIILITILYSRRIKTHRHFETITKEQFKEIIKKI